MNRIASVVLLLLALSAGEALASRPVVGGHDAPAGKWDDAAAVYFGGGEPSCTGVLVAPNVVLTAGHCIGGVTQVMVGSNTLSDGDFIPVAQQIEYPNSINTYDIGVLVLQRDAAVEPRVIATDCIRDQYVVNGGDVAIVGWGATNASGSSYPSVLQEAFTTILDADCTDIQSGCNDAVSPGGEIGAGGSGIDSCFGDSGGPLYLITDRGDYLVGITSRGFNTGGQPCGQGGIYIRPDAVMDWIESTAGVTLARPVCNLAPEPTATVTDIVVTAGESETTTIEPHDPDEGDDHTFSVDPAPEHGEVSIDAAGIATYAADGDYDGPDSFVVVVTDNGSPALSGTVQVDVEVLPAPSGCGCRTTGGAGAVWPFALIAAAWLAGRRRRRARRT